MGNRVRIELHVIKEVDLKGNATGYKPDGWYVITGYDDADSCFEYVHPVDEGPPNEYINEVLSSPELALQWLSDHENEFAGLFSWALENGMYLMDDWHMAEDLQKAWAKFEEER